MAKLSNHLEVYKLLPKTNCRQCGLAACLAFAVAVIQGHKRLDECPHLPPEIGAQHQADGPSSPEAAQDMSGTLQTLQEQARGRDLGEAARRLGAELRGDRLIIPCLGKEFSLGPEGILSSCHINPWVSLPILNYVLHGAGLEPRGTWLPLRDLPGGLDWGRFFAHRCEAPLRQVIDNYTALFKLIVDIFDGRPAPARFDSDIAVLIHPLPKLPILLCYWKPEDGMDSSLNMFFDITADKNLPIESIYTLGVGLVTMFEKIALTHGR
ncbi:MAG: DUF3786 domain-containing protein [Pseudomonadota bacterium]